MSTQKIKSVIIEENGGSEKFKVVENEIGTPGKGEIFHLHLIHLLRRHKSGQAVFLYCQASADVPPFR